MREKTSAVIVPLRTAEAQLLATAKAGNNEAREELIRQSWGRCMSVALRLLRSSDDASEVMQSAFCQALTHLGDFRGEAQFSTWVTRIVVNECIMQLRSRSTRAVSYDQTPGVVEHLVEGSCCDTDPEYSVASQQIVNVLRFELSRVPRFLRIPLKLYYLDGLTLDSVAGRLGITIMAVKARLHRGRNYLRKRMLRHCSPRSGTGLLVRT